MTMTDKKADLDWTAVLQETKEKLAKIFWGLPGLSDAERELAVKELLWELDQIHAKIEAGLARRENAERLFREENDLLRSLLGAADSELRARILGLSQEAHDVRRDLLAAREELAALRQKAEAVAADNEDLRQRLKEAQQALEIAKAREEHDWQSQVSAFADEQALLQEQLARVTEKMKEVQFVLGTQAEEMTRQKQEELSSLRAKLLAEMETALRQKEELLWSEEELFANGVAQKLRGELQASLGRLQLTLDRFHLLDVKEDQAAGSWRQWWRLLRVGPRELRSGCREAEADLRRAIKILEDYVTLFRRQVPSRAAVALPAE
jgi:uncharacterized protein YfcZ (UPF0381/DUF406 family)